MTGEDEGLNLIEFHLKTRDIARLLIEFFKRLAVVGFGAELLLEPFHLPLMLRDKRIKPFMDFIQPLCALL